jgi:hypothetical protein
MMKKVLIITALLFWTQSQANMMNPTKKVSSPHHWVSHWSLPPSTKNVMVLGALKHQRKFIASSNNLSDPTDDDVPGADELDATVGYRRPRLQQVDINPDDVADEPLSEYVQIRLLVARAKAMRRYQELYG